MNTIFKDLWFVSLGIWTRRHFYLAYLNYMQCDLVFYWCVGKGQIRFIYIPDSWRSRCMKRHSNEQHWDHRDLTENSVLLLIKLVYGVLFSPFLTRQKVGVLWFTYVKWMWRHNLNSQTNLYNVFIFNMFNMPIQGYWRMGIYIWCCWIYCWYMSLSFCWHMFEM